VQEITKQSQENAQFTVVTGRRRIGKTQLLLQATDSKSTLYFFVANYFLQHTGKCKEYIVSYKGLSMEDM